MTPDSLRYAHCHLARCEISRCAPAGSILVTKSFGSRGKPCGWKRSTIHAMPVTHGETIKSDATTHRTPKYFVRDGIEAFRSFSRTLLECAPVLVPLCQRLHAHNCVSSV